MTDNLKNLAWACLPKEAREWIRKEYQDMLNKHWFYSAYLRGRLRMMREIYGSHNLTSDTEPCELLFVEREKVADLYATMDKAFPREAAYSVQEALKSLFGDKCLPDKECPKNNAETVQNLGHSKEPSVQVEPKFKKDEIVRSISTNKVLKVYANCTGIEKSSCLCVCQDGSIEYFPIRDLEPYTEENKEPIPQTNVGICDNCQKRTLSDEELDALIYRLKKIRDRRKKLTRDLSDILSDIVL